MHFGDDPDTATRDLLVEDRLVVRHAVAETDEPVAFARIEFVFADLFGYAVNQVQDVPGDDGVRRDHAGLARIRLETVAEQPADEELGRPVERDQPHGLDHLVEPLELEQAMHLLIRRMGVLPSSLPRLCRRVNTIC